MKDELTLKQQRFCDYYLEGSGNATEAVIKAGYNVSKKKGVPDRMLARNIASENLAKPGITNYIRKKLEGIGLNDENVMKHHVFLINQFADLPTKARAIDLYYKKTGAYVFNKQKNDTNPELEAFMDRAAKLLLR